MPTGIYKRKPISEETREKLRKAHIGRKRGPMPEAAKEKLRQLNKGKKPWNTGKHWSAEVKEKLRDKRIGKKLPDWWIKKVADKLRGKKRPKFSEEWLKNISISHLGFHHTEEAKKKIGKAGMGRHHSEETRRKLSENHKGEKGPNWKGGLTPISKTLRHGIEFSLWREMIFARDNWTCQKTGIRGGELHPHHIEGFSNNKALRFDVGNGITLSKEIHKQFHKRYGNGNNSRNQLDEFLKSQEILSAIQAPRSRP